MHSKIQRLKHDNTLIYFHFSLTILKKLPFNISDYYSKVLKKHRDLIKYQKTWLMK